MPYTYPQMPLQANLWYDVEELPPIHPPDETVNCSLSPIRPEDYFRQTGYVSPSPGTHIIRTAPNEHVADAWNPPSPSAIFPCSCFECPPGSGHFYLVTWYHEVGAGFGNHHARIYVLRFLPLSPPEIPLYRGWI